MSSFSLLSGSFNMATSILLFLGRFAVWTGLVRPVQTTGENKRSDWAQLIYFNSFHFPGEMLTGTVETNITTNKLKQNPGRRFKK